MISRFRLFSGVAALAVAALGVGCAGPAVTVEHRADGLYHLKCQTTLPVCLDRAEVLCDHNRYAVLRAFDLRDSKGDLVSPTVVRSSEAFVRCGTSNVWGGENKALMAEPLCPAAPVVPAPPLTPPARACTPGASQSCAGPAGCKGGQVCAPDGNGFGPCDCGSAPAP